MEKILETDLLVLATQLHNAKPVVEDEVTFTVENAAKVTKGLQGPDAEAWRPTYDI